MNWIQAVGNYGPPTKIGTVRYNSYEAARAVGGAVARRRAHIRGEYGYRGGLFVPSAGGFIMSVQMQSGR